MPKLTPLQEEHHVLEFLTRTNRPQSVTNIVDALQAVPLKKAAVDRATAALVARGAVTLKEYGKAKVFIANQAAIALPSAEEQAELDRRLGELEEAATSSAAAVASATASVGDLSATLSDDAAVARAAAVAAERADLEGRVRAFGGGVVLSEDARAELERVYAQAMDAWRQRKRVVTEAVSLMAEGAGKKPAEMYEKIGIETDEEAGVDIKGMPPCQKPARGGRKRRRGT
ncbi:hypothetical protein I4F81_008308 [Pyropia yezoensis]|uniref:Uncharacterized protein n=1 Tax=Pyropia yezoensis TaxID=2788 RepID=A0ACC3C6D9_PYRYE|nr:hypothetical protein I4F81_008308 [Neopyropia yezoensis]